MNSSVSPTVRDVRARDAGMTLVEVMAAIALFAVLSTAVLVVLNATTKVANDDGLRVVATSLAARELDITRDTFSSATRGPRRVPIGLKTNQNPLPGGTVGDPLVVDGIPFTVEREVVWERTDNPNPSKCDDGTVDEVDYVKVTVEVSWPGLAPRPSLTMNTIMTPPKGTYSDYNKGLIGLKVLDRLGVPQRGVDVTATKAGSTTLTQTTGNDGCALFPFVDPGTWTVKVSKAGYVTQQGDAVGTLTAAVQADQIWRGSLAYDEAATLEVVVCPPENYSLPTSLTGIPVTLGNSGLLPDGSKSFPTTGSRSTEKCRIDDDDDDDDGGSDRRAAEVRTLSNLWPSSSGYQSWMGACLDNDPQHTGQTRDLPVVSDPGQTTKRLLELTPVEVEVSGLVTPVVAVQVADSACTAGARITLGTSILGGKLKTSLPYGTWRIERSSGGVPTATITVVKGGGTVSARL